MLSGKIGYFRSSFSPASLSGLAVWLDASNSSSIIFHPNNVNVATWSDLSGNSRDAVQRTSNNAPVYTIGGFNGRNCLTFNGSNASSSMELGDLSAVFPSFGEYFCAFDAQDDTDYSVYRTRVNGDLLRDNSVNSRVAAFVSTRMTGLQLNFPSNGSALVSVRVNSAGTATIRRNAGVAEVISTGNTYNPGNFHGIANNLTGLTFNGKIGEILLFNQDIGTAARARVEGYLKQKWGTP